MPNLINGMSRRDALGVALLAAVAACKVMERAR